MAKRRPQFWWAEQVLEGVRPDGMSGDRRSGEGIHSWLPESDQRLNSIPTDSVTGPARLCPTNRPARPRPAAVSRRGTIGRPPLARKPPFGADANFSAIANCAAQNGLI